MAAVSSYACPPPSQTSFREQMGAPLDFSSLTAIDKVSVELIKFTSGIDFEHYHQNFKREWEGMLAKPSPIILLDPSRQFCELAGGLPPKLTFQSFKGIDVDNVLKAACASGAFSLLAIPEDTKWRKFLACIPLVGVAFSLINQRSLMKKINECQDPEWTIKLINVKNDFKCASMIEELLSTAIIITSVAVAFFNPIGAAIAVTVGLAGVSAFAINAYMIHSNRQLIKELKSAAMGDDLLKISSRVK